MYFAPYTFGPYLASLASTGPELSRWQASDWHTDWHTDRHTHTHTHAMSIPVGQYWPRVINRWRNAGDSGLLCFSKLVNWKATGCCSPQGATKSWCLMYHTELDLRFNSFIIKERTALNILSHNCKLDFKCPQLKTCLNSKPLVVTYGWRQHRL